MRPAVREVSKEYQGKVKLTVLNMQTEAGERQAKALNARGHPALLFVDRGGEVRLRRFGPQDKAQIRRGFELLASDS